MKVACSSKILLQLLSSCINKSYSSIRLSNSIFNNLFLFSRFILFFILLLLNTKFKIEKQESRHETTIEFYRKELQKRSKLFENKQFLALESNKKIQKLENQLEEERQLNYSFDTSTNDRQNVDAQEATYTTDSVNINKHQEEEKEADIQHKDISESKSGESM